MVPADLQEILAIERVSFPSPWSLASFERDASMLVLLRDRESKAQVGANQLGAGLLARVIRRRATHDASKLLLLLRVEHGLSTELRDIQIEQVAIVVRRIHRSPPAPIKRQTFMQLYNHLSDGGEPSAAWAQDYTRFAAGGRFVALRATGFSATTAIRRRSSFMYASNTAGRVR